MMGAKCEEPAAFRYTWPGRDESLICEEHVGKLRAVAAAMGLHLQLIPVEQSAGNCSQIVSPPAA